MIRIYLGSFVLLTLGLLAGIFISSRTTETAEVAFPADAVPVITENTEDYEARIRIAALETELAALNHRLALLESSASPKEEPPATAPAATAQTTEFAGTDDSISVVEGLVAAGLNSVRAEEIARRISESQLKRLELQDKAIREGYIGSKRYREELTAIRDEQVQVRDTIDESTYDRYLYFSGQSNRVAVSSVMLGSAAESSGIQAGDVLLSYEDDALYKPGDIRGLTSQGEKDELVDLTLLRDGNRMTVSIPRGPLGVRLSAIRINPDNN